MCVRVALTEQIRLQQRQSPTHDRDSALKIDCGMRPDNFHRIGSSQTDISLRPRKILLGLGRTVLLAPKNCSLSNAMENKTQTQHH